MKNLTAKHVWKYNKPKVVESKKVYKRCKKVVDKCQGWHYNIQTMTAWIDKHYYA